MRKIIFLIIILTANVFAFEPFPGLTQRRKSEFRNFMHTGFKFDAVLKTAIFSFNIETPVIALIEYDITFLNRVVLPAGTKLIGTTSIIKTINRVNVVFTTVVLPNGDEFIFTGLALHTDGSAGIPGKVRRQAAAIPARVILGAAAVGATVVSPVAGVAAQEISAAAREELARTQQYSISVKKDTPIQVYVVNRVEY